MPENLTVVRGTKTQLTAHVMPLDADVQTFTWSSSNTELATIASDGTITVASDLSKFSDEERKVTFTATSTSNTDAKVQTNEITLVAPVESISITNAARTLFVGGENGFGTEQLAVTYLPADANENEKVVTGAYSSDDGVITVDDNLLVTAVGPGSATITVEGKNDAKTTWTLTQVLKGHILEYQSDGTNVNKYVEDTDVKTSGELFAGKKYYFRLVFTNSNSETPDSTTFISLSDLDVTMSFMFDNGTHDDGAGLHLVGVDDDKFYFERYARAVDRTITVKATKNGKELQTMSFTAKP